MNSFRNFLSCAVFLFASGYSPANEMVTKKILAWERVRLSAGIPYTSGFLRVDDNSLKGVKKIEVRVYGEYCRILPGNLCYRRFENDVVRCSVKAPYFEAVNSVSYEFGSDPVQELKFDFQQVYWDKVVCNFEFWATGSESVAPIDPNDTWKERPQVLSASKDLQIISLEFHRALQLNGNYGEVFPSSNKYNEAIKALSLKIESGQSRRDCLQFYFSLEPLWKQFYRDFLKTHSSVLDEKVDSDWDELKQMRLKLDEIIFEY